MRASLASLEGVDALIAEQGVAGVSFAVIEHGEITHTQACGVKDSSSGERVSPETLFQAGSISKPVAAFGLLRLVDQGVIGLDCELPSQLSNWSMTELAPWRPRLTPRMLLTHLAGVTVSGFPGYPPDSDLPSVVDVLEGRGNTPLVFCNAVPELTWSYSGGGTTVVQLLMTELTGEPFPELMQRLVLKPIGMTSSTFEQPLPPTHQAAAAAAHAKMTRAAHGWDAFPEMAAAGLWTTPVDIARFCIEVVRAYAGEPNSLLAAATARAMLTGHPAAPGMGIGPFLSTEGPLVFAHAGVQTRGYSCNMACAADGSVGAVAMTNSAEGMPIANAILERVGKGHRLQLPPNLEWPTNTIAAQEPTTTSVGRGGPSKPAMYQRPGMVVDVKAGAGDELDVTFGNQPSIRFQLRDGYWGSSSVETTIAFHDHCLTVRQRGQDVVLRERSGSAKD